MTRLLSFLATVILVKLLCGCSAASDAADPSCALTNLSGRPGGTVAYDDPAQPWPCGQAPMTDASCELLTKPCDTPIRWDCGDLELSLSATALTVSSGICSDSHAIHWVNGG